MYFHQKLQRYSQNKYATEVLQPLIVQSCVLSFQSWIRAEIARLHASRSRKTATAGDVSHIHIGTIEKELQSYRSVKIETMVLFKAPTAAVVGCSSSQDYHHVGLKE